MEDGVICCPMCGNKMEIKMRPMSDKNSKSDMTKMRKGIAHGKRTEKEHDWDE